MMRIPAASGLGVDRSTASMHAALLLLAAAAFDGKLRFVLGLPLVAAAALVAARALFGSTKGLTARVPASVWMGLAAVSALGIVTPTGGPLWYEIVRRAFAASGVLLVGLAWGAD